MDDPGFRVFISYSRDDERQAKWLQARLEGWRPPSSLPDARALHPVFRDRDNLAAAVSLTDAIRRGLDASENLVVLCSRAAVASRWVDEEIRAFRDLGRAQRIFGLVVEPDASVPVADCLPGALLEAGEDEPLLADLRSTGDGRRLAFAKIVAALADADLGTLLQREAQRRARRLVTVATVSVVLAATMSALALSAYLARSEAVEAREDAELRREQAEALVTYMLGDLRGQLEAVGRVDLLADVGQQAAQYFDAVPPERLTSEELHQRARMTRQFGVDRLSAGEIEPALGLFATARGLDEALAGREDASKDWLLGLSLSHYWTGAAHYQRDDLGAALASFEGQRDALDRLSRRFPGDAEVLENLAYVRNNVGMIQRARGELSAARGSIEGARTELIELAEEYGIDGLELSIIDAGVVLGELHFRIGRIEDSVGVLRDAERRVEARLEASPRDVDVVESAISVQRYLGEALSAAADSSWAVHVERQLALAEALRQTDPESAEFAVQLAVARARMSELLLARDDVGEAVDAATTSVDVLAEQARIADDDARLARRLLVARFALARALLADGRPGAAQQALEMDAAAGRAIEAGPELDFERALLVGRALEAHGRSDEARSVWRTALNAVVEDMPSATNVPVDSRLARAASGLAQALGSADDAGSGARLATRGWAVGPS